MKKLGHEEGTKLRFCVETRDKALGGAEKEMWEKPNALAGRRAAARAVQCTDFRQPPSSTILSTPLKGTAALLANLNTSSAETIHILTLDTVPVRLLWL